MKTKTKKSKGSRKHFLDVDLVRSSASGRWLEILQSLAGIPLGILDGNHHPCPRCGGSDRFRLVDRSAGAVICNQCFSSRNGDGFAAMQWMTGVEFLAAVGQVAQYLGIEANGNGSATKSKPPSDSHLEFRSWNRVIAGLWASKKQPITVAAAESVGCKIARYRNQFTVLAVPVIGQQLDTSKPVGWAIYNTTGGPLPKLGQNDQVEWISKPKLTFGSQPGVIGDIERIKSAAVVWKLEGISDLLAWYSMPGVPDDHAAFTNAMGCSERPAKWMAELCRDKLVYVVHDCDMPGQRGATGWTENGRQRPGWCGELASAATECRNVVLPYPIAETHGQDLRDWIAAGGTFEELRKLAASGNQFQAGGQQAREANDDPYRLARLNLERYATRTHGRTLRFWKGAWWVWKNCRYITIDEVELRAKLTASIKEEFDRLNIEEQQRYEEKRESGETTEEDRPPVAKKVTPQIVGSVLNATRGMVCMSGESELDTWIPSKERRNYISLANGLLDVDALMLDQDKDKVLLPHSPNWFSTVHLPYGFDPSATCPKFDAFLERNLQMDPERIKVLQEWAGYLLLPDTGEQRFLILEGEGANGKSVFCAAIEALLGSNNCSHVQLECFGDRFSKTSTLGKLVNICGDAGEIDKVAEGTIKAFASGNVLFFDRKGLSGVSCVPTARLMIACNNRPRFSDRSDGVWRRMLLIPWLVKIPREDRVQNMDKAWWWTKSGEVPGILNWAIRGLYRLRAQGGFTPCAIMDKALGEYQVETNSARHFLMEFVVRDKDGVVGCSWMYRVYSSWAKSNGYRPISSIHFGKEVARLFHDAEKRRLGSMSARKNSYVGIAMSNENELPWEGVKDNDSQTERF